MGTAKRPSSGATQVCCDAILWVKRPCAPIAIFQVRANDPDVLWPWEALYNPQSGAFFAHHQRLERRLKRSPAPQAAAGLPNERVNILLVVCRPSGNDVRHRSIARPLIQLTQSSI